MYLNIVELAESFGVSEGVIADWISREGLPHTADRERILFDRAQVAQWAASRGLAAKSGFLAPETTSGHLGWSLSALAKTGGIWRDVDPADVPACFAGTVNALPGIAPAVRQWLARRLLAPGGITWAPVGGGWALPHPSARVSLGRDAGLLSLVFLRSPLRLTEAPAEATPITRLAFFIAPSPRAHLDLLGRISRLLTRDPAAARLDPAHPDAMIYEALRASDEAWGSHHPERKES